VAVKRYGSTRDFDTLISVLLRGIGAFTIVIAAWLVTMIL
jgi:hypothetical protein